MKVGGSDSIIKEVKRLGGEPGPRTFWIGSWVLKSGWGGLDSFYKSCKEQGDQPLVHLWTFGDMLNEKGRTIDEILVEGGTDPHQDVKMDWAIARSMAEQVARRAKAAGVNPIVTVESEFTKKGDDGASSVKMRDFLWDISRNLRKEHDKVKLVFAPGVWADAKKVGTHYKDVARSMDYIGVQCVKFLPRHGDYSDSVDEIISKLKTYRDIIGNKPTCVHDIALSTYAGGEKTHPFRGGDGEAAEEMQAKTLGDVRRLHEIGIEFIILRELKDNPKFALSNYGGHAERHIGIIRANGNKKPGYRALMDLLVTREGDVEDAPPWQDLIEAVEQLHERVDGLYAKFEEASSLRSEVEGLKVRIKAIRDALGD